MWRRAKRLHTVREDDLHKVASELAKADDGDGLLTVAEFQAAWARLGLPLTADEAAQLIARGAPPGPEPPGPASDPRGAVHARTVACATGGAGGAVGMGGSVGGSLGA